MKTSIRLLTACLLVNSASAEFRTWTREDGKTADLELTSTSGEGADKAGEFKMRNGRSVTIKASALTAADAKLLNEWTAPTAPRASAPRAAACLTRFSTAISPS